MDIRLIAFDLDGTLLTSQKRMTHRSRTALERAARAGVALVPATGRIFRGIPEEVRARRVSLNTRKCVLYNDWISPFVTRVG